MVAVAGPLVPFVVMKNVADVLLSATETLAGTTADLELEKSFTTMDPLWAPGAALRVAVPVAFPPAATLPGLTDRDISWNGFTVSVAD
jgi:hypothetical protein